MVAIHGRSRVLSESSASTRISGVSGSLFDGKKIRSFKNTKGNTRHFHRKTKHLVIRAMTTADTGQSVPQYLILLPRFTMFAVGYKDIAWSSLQT